METLKKFGGVILAIGVFAIGIALWFGLATLGIAIVHGIAWLSERIFQYVVIVNSVVFLVSLFILLPLAVFRVTRKVSTIGLMVASYSFGLTVWIFGFIVTYVYWGAIGVLIGLFLAFVGIVPFGIVAAAINEEWSIALQLLIVLVLTFGTRMLALWLADKVDKHEAQKARKLYERQAVPR